MRWRSRKSSGGRIRRCTEDRYNSRVITQAEWSVRQQQWAEYRRWAQAETPLLLAPEDSIADIGALLEWIPESTRNEMPDPDRRGVRRMHSLLGLLSADARHHTLKGK